jgi:uncharacterized protein
MLIRTALVRADTVGRTLYGRLVPYGSPADVNDGRGTYREEFAPGAFTRSIQQRGSKVRLFVQHDTRRMPIGRAVELEERADGLHGAFALPNTRDADDALELVTSGTVDGFSIGFRPVRDREQRGTSGKSVIRVEAALLEVSLVHTPAYDLATVAGVRAASTPQTAVSLAARRLALKLKTW